MKGISDTLEIVSTSATVVLQVESFFLTSHLILFSFLQVRLMYPCCIPSGCVEQSPFSCRNLSYINLSYSLCTPAKFSLT